MPDHTMSLNFYTVPRPVTRLHVIPRAIKLYLVPELVTRLQNVFN